MKTKNKTHYRQGDVAIERVSSLPAGLKKVARENGRVVLSHGEVTGHAHFFAETAVEKFAAEDGAEFFRIGGSPIRDRLPILRRWKDQVLVQHPKFGAIEFAVADIEIVGDVAIVDGKFGLLRHNYLSGAPTATPDHNTQALPAGCYRGGNVGGSVGQSEFDPEEIRRVID